MADDPRRRRTAPNLWVGRLPVLAIAVFTACLGLAAWPQRAAAAWAGRWPRATLTAGGAMLALALIAVSLWPTAGVGARSLPGEADIRLALVLASALVLVALGAMHWQRWRLERDRMQLALVVACLLSAGALLSLQLGRLWHLAWWDYHAFLLAGFAAAIYAVLTGYRRSRTLQEVLGEVFASDPMAHISRGYSETLRALIGAVEARDAYTHGHSARVAELSVQVGLRLGLRPAALRTLAEGPTCATSARSASPTTSLTSRAPYRGEAGLDPGTPHCRLRHRRAGAVAARRPGGDPPAPRALRRGGYPDGLAGEEISLAARIVAVADVWDALTSDRAYRPAWPPDRALRHLEAGRGSHFDPRCLDAFLALMAERGHRPGNGDGDAAVADAAAEACHDQPQAEAAATPPVSFHR